MKREVGERGRGLARDPDAAPATVNEVDGLHPATVHRHGKAQTRVTPPREPGDRPGAPFDPIRIARVSAGGKPWYVAPFSLVYSLSWPSRPPRKSRDTASIQSTSLPRARSGHSTRLWRPSR